jgi:sulfite exporter TauE/SafE
MNLWIIFLTGLTTGGLTCLAMQGGLLAGVIANQKEKDLDDKVGTNKLDKNDWLPVAMFLGAKLISHTLLGFLLGALGSVITLSVGVRLGFQMFAALFMFATAMNLLNVHPIFRYVVIQPPKYLRRKVSRLSKDDSLFAPAFLGFFTIFIPCGVTQAMEILAINSGSAIEGALIMFAFVLGTSPLFAIIGVATSRFSEVFQEKFMKVAAALLIIMSLYAINGVLVVLDAPFSAQKITWMYQAVKTYESGQSIEVNLQPSNKPAVGVQQVAIEIENSGYTPNRIKVNVGQPVELTLINNGAYTCASAFTLREFGIDAYIKPNTSQKFEFIPKKTGKFIFACSMGMYTGTLEVI